MKAVLIIGCGGHAKSIANIAIKSGISIQAFYDDNAQINEYIMGIPVLKMNMLNEGYAIIGVGDNHQRQEIFMAQKRQWINLISTYSDFSTLSRLGVANFISSQSYIGPDTVIGNNNIINTGAIIEHDVIIGDHNHISIGSRIAGKVTIGNGCFIGAGATIIQGIKIADDVIIGAGAVVIHNINESGTYVGIPANKI